MFINIKVSRCR